MLLRRATPLALAIAALACEPSVPYSAANNPLKVDYAGFDPTGNPPSIPLPNSLALLPSSIASVAAQSPAQAALLTQWAQDVCVDGMPGCFPNDQEVPITIDFVTETLDPNTGAPTRSAPTLDLSSINAGNLIVLSLTTLGSGAVACDPPQAADYVVNGDHGTLTIHKSADPKQGGSRRWPANSVIVAAVRGGASGVKVTGGAPAGLQPQPAMYLLLQDVNLTIPANQGIIPGATRADKAAAAAQLELIRKSYEVPFAAVDGAWGALAHRQIATMGVFKVADTSKHTHVETDPGGSPSGLPVPFPSDFMMDATGHLSAAAQPAFGPLGPGLATLDGFSTTAMMLSGTSAYVQASTVAGGVFLFEFDPGAAQPFKRLADISELAVGKSPGYAAEPSVITRDAVTGGACSASSPATCLSNVLGLQPGVPAQISATALFPIPPLKEATTYVVLVTDKVKDLNGDPLTRSTLGKLLLLDPTISIAMGGHSTVSGVSDAQAVGLDQMRLAINGAAQTLLAEKTSLAMSDLVMGYTFKTQSITSAPNQLAALPYAPACSATVTTDCLPSAAVAALAGPVPSTTALFCTAGAGGCVAPSPTPVGNVGNVFDQFGADKTVVPNGNIAAIVESVIVTLNNLTDPSGSFSDPTKVPPAPEAIPVLISVPAFNNVATGPSTLCSAPPCAAPLVVFRHGLGSSRAAMLLVADRFAKAGIVVAAIDGAKDGARSYCMPAKNGTPLAECVAGSTCTPDPALANQGDTASTGTPGKCSGATPTDPKFVNKPTECSGAACTAFASANAGTPAASGNFVISGNLFRTRDTFRQDVIDQSQLIHVLAVNPLAPPTGSAADIFNAIAATGVVIDPTRVYWVGQSMGGVTGTMDLAVNPRITKALFNVSGGSMVDIFTNAPAFASSIGGLLTALGIAPGTAAYLQFVNVAKWILDPADPLNFGSHITSSTLPNLIKAGLPPPLNSDPMLPKKVLGQMASCDDTVPNPFNLNLYQQLGLGPDTGSTTNGTLTTFISPSTINAACPGGVVKHGFLGDWIDYPAGASSIAQQGQDDAAAFFLGDVHPPLQRFAP